MTRATARAIIRRTTTRPVSITGTGLFTGRPAACTIRPAAAGAGICFRRTDLPGSPTVAALIANLSTAAARPAFEKLPARHTALAGPGVRILTVEHILSALTGLGITDTLIDIEGDELPIGDGSAAPFAERLAEAGITDLSATITPIALDRPLSVSDASGARIDALPAEAPHYSYHLDYGPASPIPAQSASWSGDPADYTANIAPARTFCLEHEARAMQALGLFNALTPRDMLVFGPRGPIDNTLRSPNEPARHKLLDLIGDLSLAGRPILARIAANRSGHALNHEMARLLAGL